MIFRVGKRKREFGMHLDLEKYQNRHSLRSKIRRMLWNVVWSCLFRPTPCIFFNWWRIFLLRFFGAKIGNQCIIYPSCQVWQPWKLSIGNYVALSDQVECYSVDNIEIGDNVTICQGAFLCSASHDISSPIMELTHAPIIIESQAWVAVRAFVGKGVTIGKGAIIEDCAVVTKNVTPWTVMVGNPAIPVMCRSSQPECA